MWGFPSRSFLHPCVFAVLQLCPPALSAILSPVKAVSRLDARAILLPHGSFEFIQESSHSLLLFQHMFRTQVVQWEPLRGGRATELFLGVTEVLYDPGTPCSGLMLICDLRK